MLSGYNHNVKHAGNIFHIQTEDFGRGTSEFVAQVFLGGTLIAKERHSYADIDSGPPEDAISDPVRIRMRDFHTEIIERLTSGAYDSKEEAPGVIKESIFPIDPEELEAFILKYFCTVLLMKEKAQ